MKAHEGRRFGINPPVEAPKTHVWAREPGRRAGLQPGPNDKKPPSVEDISFAVGGQHDGELRCAFSGGEGREELARRRRPEAGPGAKLDPASSGASDLEAQRLRTKMDDDRMGAFISQRDRDACGI